MSRKVHTITNYGNLIEILSRPNSDLNYKFIPDGYIELEPITLEISNLIVYSDIYIGNIIKYYQSFTPELLNSNERFLSPLYFNICMPVYVDPQMLQKEQFPIDIISKIMMSQYLGHHIPKPHYKWTPNIQS